MSDFIKHLNEIVRSPEDIQREIELKNQELYNDAVKKWAAAFHYQILEKLSKSAKRGKYKIINGKKFSEIDICSVNLSRELEKNTVYPLPHPKINGVYLSFVSQKQVLLATSKGIFQPPDCTKEIMQYSLTEFSIDVFHAIKNLCIADEILVEMRLYIGDYELWLKNAYKRFPATYHDSISYSCHPQWGYVAHPDAGLGIHASISF